MRPLSLFALGLALVAIPCQAASTLDGRGFVLAGEAVLFDADLRPLFTAGQRERSAAATRAGLARWAATSEGRAMIQRFRGRDAEIEVIESAEEQGIGRAPQPGFATLLAIADPTKVKRFQLILNPSIAAQYHNGSEIDLGLPRTADDVMAAAWAGEMLHIDFYARGIPLPHHDRAEFQQRWLTVAGELGLGRMEHGGEEPRAPVRRSRTMRGRAW